MDAAPVISTYVNGKSPCLPAAEALISAPVGPLAGNVAHPPRSNALTPATIASREALRCATQSLCMGIFTWRRPRNPAAL